MVPIFSDLNQAVQFIVACLDSEDFDRLCDACQKARDDVALQTMLESTHWHPKGFPTPREDRLRVILALKERHQSTRLDRLYAHRQFPADAKTYKLGGHAAELGHIHIDFGRSGMDWFVENIWMCR